jgi:flavin-dependent dehydrogenase
MVAQKLGLREGDANLRNCSLFTRYRGARRGEGRDEGATLILYTGEPRTWFWFIPLPDDVVSVGVVGPVDRLVKQRQGNPQSIFAEELAMCPALGERLEGAEQLHDIQAVKDFSYATRRLAGNGWVVVGDASGFLDPIYSSGVFLALKGGEFVADSINDALANDDVAAARLGQHTAEYTAGVEAMRQLVYAYYSPEFNFAAFLQEFPECKDELVNLLIGNVYRKSVSRLLESMHKFCELPGYEPYRFEEAPSS